MYIIYENIFEIFKYIIYWMKKKKKKSNFTFIEKPEINENDLEMISTNLCKHENDYKNIIYRIIKDISIKSKGKKATKNGIIEKANEFGIDIMRVEDGIERLKRSKTINGYDEIYIIK